MTFLVNPFWYPPNTPIVQGATINAQAAASVILAPNPISAAALSAGASAAMTLAGSARLDGAFSMTASATMTLDIEDADKVWASAVTSTMTMAGAAISRAAASVITTSTAAYGGAAIGASPLSAAGAASATMEGDVAEMPLLELMFETDVTTDTGGGGYSWTNSGAVRTTTNSACGVGALEFGGTDSLSTGTLTEFQTPGPAACCMEAWVRRLTASSPSVQIAVSGDVGSTLRATIQFNNGGDIDASWSAESSGSAIFTRSVNAVEASVDDDWHHVAMDFDGSTYRLFWDGALKDSFSSSTRPFATSPVAFFDVATNSDTGYYENFRLWTSSRYTAAFTPSC